MQFLSFYLDLSCSMLSRSLARVSDVPRVVFICCFCVRCLIRSCVLCGQKAENAKWEETRRRERWDTLFLAVVESQPRSQGLSSSRQKQRKRGLFSNALTNPRNGFFFKQIRVVQKAPNFHGFSAARPGLATFQNPRAQSEFLEKSNPKSLK